MAAPRLADQETLRDAPLRLAEPADLDPRQVPFLSLWVRTDDDPDPADSPVLDAYGGFAEAVDGFEDAFWTALHWATGEVPTTAAVPAPPGLTRRVLVWRDEELLAVSASPAKGIRPAFPPQMGVDRRVAHLSWFARVTRRMRAGDLGDVFREPVSDYRTLAAYEDLRDRLDRTEEPLGAVACFYTVEADDA